MISETEKIREHDEIKVWKLPLWIQQKLLVPCNYFFYSVISSKLGGFFPSQDMSLGLIVSQLDKWEIFLFTRPF